MKGKQSQRGCLYNPGISDFKTAIYRLLFSLITSPTYIETYGMQKQASLI